MKNFYHLYTNNNFDFSTKLTVIVDVIKKSLEKCDLLAVVKADDRPLIKEMQVTRFALNQLIFPF